jgi:predicted Zn-dependent protease
MKFKGLLVSHVPKIAAVLAASLLATQTPSQAQLPTLGDGSEMTTSAERKLGERIAREIYRDPDYIDDPVLSEYVQNIWQVLLAAARARGELTAELDERFAWEVMLGRDRTINAFALPGGYLGVHLGLIGIVTSRDELASVLAHELSHVTQRHIARLTSQQSRQTPWVLGAMILGALAASKSPEAANAMIAGGQALAIQNQLNFSRDMEREADRIGYSVMTQGGFAPQGFVTMFDKLQHANRLNDTGAFPYLRSHPLTTERIADMQARQSLEGKPGVAQVQRMDHAMVTARARVLSNPGVDTLRGWIAEPDGAPFTGLSPLRQASALYAAALAQARQRNFAEARKLVARLTPLTAAEPPAARLCNLLAAEIEWGAGNAQRTVALLGESLSARPELFLAAQARTQLGQAADVAQRLQSWVALHPRDAQAWQLLAGAYAAQGQSLRAIRAEAEARAAQLDYAAARDRFRAAQDMVRRGEVGKLPGDHIEVSIIDTRLRQVELVLREQALER